MRKALVGHRRNNAIADYIMRHPPGSLRYCRSSLRENPHYRLAVGATRVQPARLVRVRVSGIQKTFKYIMSHYTGKIEILDLTDERVYMRYHQNKRPEKIGRVFSRRYIGGGACWLDDLPAD